MVRFTVLASGSKGNATVLCGGRTRNYLLTPEHPDAKKIEIAEVIKEQFDNRLFRFGAR